MDKQDRPPYECPPDLAATFRERVAGYQNLGAGDHPSVKIDLDADGRERLRSLGYLK